MRKGSVPCLFPNFWWFADNHRCSLVCRSITLISTFIFTKCLFCVCICVQISSFHKNINHIGLGTHPFLYDLILIELHLQLYLQISSHSEALGVRIATYTFLQCTIQPITDIDWLSSGNLWKLWLLHLDWHRSTWKLQDMNHRTVRRNFGLSASHFEALRSEANLLMFQGLAGRVKIWMAVSYH